VAANLTLGSFTQVIFLPFSGSLHDLAGLPERFHGVLNQPRRRVMISRRQFLLRMPAISSALIPALTDDWFLSLGDLLPLPAGERGSIVAQDEIFWGEIQRAFTVDRTIINLNNGGVSPSPRIVQEAMARNLAYSNAAPSHTMWDILEPQVESVRRDLARHFGCDPEELAITRNASEALEICQFGLDLEPGDEVLTTDQDYPRMLTTWDQRSRRDGVVIRKISFPVPLRNPDDLVVRFEQAITPRTRVIMFCHITNLTGQIFPVRQLVELGRSRGIEVIVDGAQAFAHFPFRRDDLDCDYYGTSLHKWLMAPHGTGFLYVRKSKIPFLWPLMGASTEQSSDVRKFEEVGTHPAANHNAIAEALLFHETVGAERKAARLRFLRDRWSDRLAEHPRITILTSRQPDVNCGLATFSVEGVDVVELAAHLWSKHRILVTPVLHSQFSGIRVTAAVYTTLPEIDSFSQAVEIALDHA
jgi:isopenicillin-N epimerase